MPLVADECVCVRKVEYSETSQILTLMSREHGLVSVMAKGAHRRTKAGASRFDGGIDLLDSGIAVFTDDSSRDLATLTEWKLREGHLELRQDLRSLYLALYAAELVSLLIEAFDPHPEIYRLISNCLPELSSIRREEIFLAFELGLLRDAGYFPELNVCAMCGTNRAPPAGFSADRAGIICRDCKSQVADAAAVDPRLLRLIQMVAALESESPASTRRLPHLTRHQTDPLNAMLARLLEHTLSRRLRMARYILDRQSANAGLKGVLSA